MNKTLLAVATIATVTAVSSPALAADLVVEEPAIATAAFGQGDWYVSLFAGGTITEDVVTLYTDYDYTVGIKPGYALGLVVGLALDDTWNVEVELSHGEADADDYSWDFGSGAAHGTLSTTYLLGNIWYDLPTGSAVTPYIGGGLGAGYATGDILFGTTPYGYGKGSVGLAFQVGAGVKFDVADNVALDFGYRYKSILGVDFTDSDGAGTYENADIHSHVLQAGLTFKF